MRLPVVALLVTAVLAGSEAAAAGPSDPISAVVYAPNWVRSPSPRTVLLDDDVVRLDGDRSRLVGVLTLASGAERRFIIKDSQYGELVLDPVHNEYNVGEPFLDQLNAFYHAKLLYERLYRLGLAERFLPQEIVIDVHADHTNAYYKADINIVSMGYHDSDIDGRRHWYGADGEVLLHELGHAIVHHVQPDIQSFEGAIIHEAYADYIAMVSSSRYDECIGEYASDFHGELLNNGRWACSRSARNSMDNRRATALYNHRFFGSFGKQGQMKIHDNAKIIVTPFYYLRRLYILNDFTGGFATGQDLIDHIMLTTLLDLPVEAAASDALEAPIHPSLRDWSIAVQVHLRRVGEQLPLFNNFAFRYLDHRELLFTDEPQMIATEDQVNRHMPWLMWAGPSGQRRGSGLFGERRRFRLGRIYGLGRRPAVAAGHPQFAEPRRSRAQPAGQSGPARRSAVYEMGRRKQHRAALQSQRRMGELAQQQLGAGMARDQHSARLVRAHAARLARLHVVRSGAQRP